MCVHINSAVVVRGMLLIRALKEVMKEHIVSLLQ